MLNTNNEVLCLFARQMSERMFDERITHPELSRWLLEEGITVKRLKAILTLRCEPSLEEMRGIAEALCLKDFLPLLGVNNDGPADASA